MAEAKVLVKGIHTMNESGEIRIASTCTLIKTDKNILVDTSSFHEKNELLAALKKEGLAPEDIDMVVLTHLHLDHTVNVSLFTNACVLCKFREGYPGQMHFPSKGYIKRFELTDGTEISKDVTVLETPGHTGDMISLVVNTKKGVVVIAGDAFSDETYLDLNKEPSPLLNDVQKFNESRKKILAIADYIVPGHGNMFKAKP